MVTAVVPRVAVPVLWCAAVPELPEVEVIRRCLLPALLGRQVWGVDARPVRLREGIEPRQWAGLVGRRPEGLERHGKFLFVNFGPDTALFHLGMSGRLLLRSPELPRLPHTHLVLSFEGEVDLCFADPRRFGCAIVIPRERIATHRSLASLGPDAVTPEAGEALVAAARRSRVAIRNLLLDQTVMAGMGNIYATEALARAGIRPTRRAATISLERLGRLAAAVHEVLYDALAAGGTTLADGGFQDAGGQEGYFAVALRVYDREGEPCPSCGTPIRRVVLTGRSTYYCPRCQR